MKKQAGGPQAGSAEEAKRAKPGLQPRHDGTLAAERTDSRAYCAASPLKGQLQSYLFVGFLSIIYRSQPQLSTNGPRPGLPLSLDPSLYMHI